MKKGLLMINTGNGKGKTTASLGLAVRALGNGFKVCIVQFIKGDWKYGETVLEDAFKGNIDFHIMGRGFTWKSDDLEKDKQLAQKAWEFAKTIILSEKYQMVILDELTYLISYNMVTEEEITSFLTNRPKNLHIVLTGRDASSSLIEIADLVTEMKSVKHHYENGIKAQKGIEY